MKVAARRLLEELIAVVVVLESGKKDDAMWHVPQELQSANGGRFEIDQLLFADDTALVADSEEKLCRLVSEFGRVCERRKLRVNVGKSKVMRCSRYSNGDRMHVILNGESLEEVDCFKYLWSQVAADGGCEMDVVHIMNEGV